MPTYELIFEAMMANITAPPLSLGEFRLFVAHDPKAQNALAFCEWYQRYRTVYFDHGATPTATLSSTTSWLDTPATAEAAELRPQCGYRPVPKQVSKLIIPNNVPPALFETTAKISASYLLQHYFADFYTQAHYNLSAAEQRFALAAASILLVLGVGTAATVAAAAAHTAWRAFAVPLLVGSTLSLSAAWTRIGVLQWLLRTRPTSLIAQAPGRVQPGDEELAQSAGRSDVDMHAVRSVTGTLWMQRPAGLAGTLAATSCLPGTSSTPGAARNALDTAVRLMLRKHCVGDQWYIDFYAKRYRVLEPLVLRGQCYSVGHQAAVLVVVWCAVAAALFLVP